MRVAHASFKATFRAELTSRHALRPNSAFKYTLKNGQSGSAFFILPKVQAALVQAVALTSLPSNAGKERELLSELK